MLRAHVLRAAVVAVALAVGASLAFRSVGENRADQARKSLRSSKSATRQPEEQERRSRTEREARNQAQTECVFGCETIPLPREKVERFLQKSGRSARNLYAASVLTGEESYREELRAMRDDPVAMALMANMDRDCARRARELDPKNLHLILLEAGQLLETESTRQEAISVFLHAADAEGYLDYRESTEETCRKAMLDCGTSFSLAWQMSLMLKGFAAVGARDDPFADSLVTQMAAQMNQSPGTESSSAIRRALLHMANLPGSCSDQSLPGDLQDALRGQPNVDFSRIESWKVAHEQERKKDQIFTIALEIATPQQLKEAESNYRREGMESAYYALTEAIGREKLAAMQEERAKSCFRSGPLPPEAEIDFDGVE